MPLLSVLPVSIAKGRTLNRTNLMNMSEIIDFLNSADLAHGDLILINGALKNAYARRNRTLVNQYHVGQRVSWTARSGGTATGVITQINTKTATVREEVTDKLWRIPAGMLKPYVTPE